MALSIERTERYMTTLDNRMTFHFGNVSVTKGSYHVLELDLEVDGERTRGLSIVGAAPMWFLKDPDVSLGEGIEALLDAYGAACEFAEELEPADSVFDLWHGIYERQAEWGADTDYPPLLWGYGVSAVEQALIDAFCRHEGTTFAAAVRENAFGIEPGRIYPELEGTEPADFLPDEPVRSTSIRHTVGLSDPLRAEEIDPEDRLEDGLPQALDEYVETDGIDHFKIKLSADADRDEARLEDIAATLEETGLSSYAFTLDANEQYDGIDAFRSQWESLQDNDALASFLDNLLYVEQPLPRSEALTDRTREVLTAWDESPPVIIDESDDRLTSAGEALDCGYAGTSHKNCKGVFKGVVNACLIERRSREDPGGEYVISGEDLTTLGPVELTQDLAVMATLGKEHVERNGHHYYRGLSMWDEGIQDATLEAHGDLYRRHERGFPTLDVADGEARFDSVVDAPFGRAVDLDPSRFTPVEEWSLEEGLQ